MVPLGDGPSILPALEKGVVDGTVLTTPIRLMAKTMGFREMLDFDQLGIPYPYVGVSTLKANVKKRIPDDCKIYEDPHRRYPDIQNQQRNSTAVMKKYFRGASDYIFAETTVTSAPRFKNSLSFRRMRSASLRNYVHQIPK